MKSTQLFEGPVSPRQISADPYIIAEIGVNHEGSLALAKRLIEQAKEAGADAVKFQSYKAETLASRHSPAYWDLTKEPTRSQFELFKKHDSFWKKEFEALKRHCDKSRIEFLSTPFDITSAGFLNDLVATFKISSSDITNKPFIEYIASFGKPIILSTGASTMSEIHKAVSWIDASGNPLALLHCVLNYPTYERNAHLAAIQNLKAEFPDRIIGYSDHTLPQDMKTLEVAVLLGARIIEKHFTHDKSLPGNDHYHAMDKNDLINLKKSLARLKKILGNPQKDNLIGEQSARVNARRSLVAKRRIKKGKAIRERDLTWKRPATGISPELIASIIGRKAAQDIPEDALLRWKDIVKKTKRA